MVSTSEESQPLFLDLAVEEDGHDLLSNDKSSTGHESDQDGTTYYISGISSASHSRNNSNGYQKLLPPSSTLNHKLPNGITLSPNIDKQPKSSELAIDFGGEISDDDVSLDSASDVLLNGDHRTGKRKKTGAEKCFGEKSDVERVLDERCICLRSKCIHLSGTLILVAAIGIVLVYLLRHHLKEILQWLQGLNAFVGCLLFIVLFTLVSFPMTWGYIVLNLAAGYLYGFFLGLFIVTISVSVGVAVSMVVCRMLLKDFIQSKLQSEHLKAIIRVVESRRGFKVVMLTRLTPIPFGLQNGLFALTNMSIYKCLVASLIGLLPTQTLNTYIGSSLRTMEDILRHRSLTDYVMLAVQLGISAFLMWYLIRRARFELNKACLPPSTYEQLEERLKQQKTTCNEDFESYHNQVGRLSCSPTLQDVNLYNQKDHSGDLSLDETGYRDIITDDPSSYRNNTSSTSASNLPTPFPSNINNSHSILHNNASSTTYNSSNSSSNHHVNNSNFHHNRVSSLADGKRNLTGSNSSLASPVGANGATNGGSNRNMSALQDQARLVRNSSGNLNRTSSNSSSVKESKSLTSSQSGHKRAHSASAILYAMQQSKLED